MAHRICLLLLLLPIAAAFSQAPVNYRDVGVIINDNDTNSVAIGEYFALKRNIPARNLIRVRVPSSETINDSVFSALRAQIELYLTSTKLADSLNYLVLTKGVPHRVDRGGTGGDLNSRSASVDAELMLILGQWSTHIGQATLVLPPSSVRVHPYFRQNERYARKKLIPNSSTTYDLYLTTRLTGLTKNDVMALIDRSGPFTVVNKDSAQFVFDMDPKAIDPTYNNNLSSAAQILQQRGWNVILNRDSLYVTGQRNVLGYSSWGSNDHYDHHYTQFARPMNLWTPASIAETYVSTSARNFIPGQTAGQSRIADLIAEGCTGASGYVFEPFSVALTWVNTLFDRYSSGYNLAESFYMANPTMSWMAIIVGDPKTSILSTVPRIPHPILHGPTTVCVGDVPTVNASNALEGTMLWFDGDTTTVKSAGAPIDEQHPLWLGRDSVLTRRMDQSGIVTISFYNENFIGAGWAQHRFLVNEVPRAGFVMDRDTAYLEQGGTVRFTDTTRGATSWSWNFGDGSPLNNAQSPTHAYSAAGIFTVSLDVSNGQCGARTDRSVLVLDRPTEVVRTRGTAPVSLLLGNAPNPFHHSTTIGFELATGGDALLEIFDMLGRIVTRYTRPGLPAGRHSVVWNASDRPAGIYRCVLTTSAGSSAISLVAR